MTASFRRNWILLWAFMPIFAAFFQMSLHRFLHDTVAIESYHTWGITFVFFTSAGLFLIAPFLVLKKHIPIYGFSFHILALLSVLLGWSSISGFAIKRFPPEEFVRLERNFSYAIFFRTHNAQSFFSNFINLSWGNLLLARMITAAAVFIGPIFLVCMAAMCLRSFPKAMLFVVLAAAAIAISEVFFDLFFGRRFGMDVLNNRAWSERLAIIVSWSASSAIGASISALGIGPVVEQCDTDRMR